MNDLTPRYCSQCGTPCRPDQRFCKQCGSPLHEERADAPPGPPAQDSYPRHSPGQPPPAQGLYPQQPPVQGSYPQQPPVQGPYAQQPPVQGPYPQQPPVQQAYAYPPPPPRRRFRGGCLGGCLGVVLILGMLAGGFALWRWLVPPRSGNLTLGRRVAVLTETISPSGGALVVQQTGSDVDGLRIGVPAGAYGDDTRFQISTRQIEAHRLGPDFSPVTPLIRIDNGHGFAAEPMTVEIPIQIGDGEFAMAFFYDQRTGKLEGIPLVALDRDRITLLTSHFSDIVVSKVALTRLEKLTLDTGFRPGIDDWHFPNRGSIVAVNGHCAGQSISAMWYYLEEHKGAGKPPLNGSYDNNDLRPRTPALWQDDAWGYRFASSVQRSIEWETLDSTISRSLGGLDSRLTLAAFAYAMHLTGEPQYVSIGRYETVGDKQVRFGHALVAYKIENGKLHVADPNYAGQEGRTIPFADNAFKPYASGSNVDEIETAGPTDYPEIRYLAKSALVDWERVRTLYEAMLRDEGGREVFPSYVLSLFVEMDENGEPVWAKSPRVLELTQDQTAEAGEHLRGKLLAYVDMDAGTRLQVQVFRGTQVVHDTGQVEQRAHIELPLEEGVNDLGFYIQVRHTLSGKIKYVDFWRVKVLYEPVDLTGVWEGTWQVEDAGNALGWVEDLLVRILLWTGLVENEQQAREAASAGIEVDPNLYAERPIRLVFDPPAPDRPNRYPVHVVTVSDEGNAQESTGEAIYDQGEVSLSLKHADGSKFTGLVALTGNDRVDGEFAIQAWGGVIQNAVTGNMHLTRQMP